MNERFERVFSLPGIFYAPSAPIIISAGALLKDTETEKILAQLKFKSISPKPIKAIKVKISPMDTIGKPIGDKVFFDYLDLNIQRDAEFGQKKAIPMPDSSTRSFSAEVVDVVFTDNSIWECSEKKWNSLPSFVRLEDALGGSELANQYRILYGQSAKYLPVRADGIWSCSCGAVNDVQEESCHICGNSLTSLLACDKEQLASDCHQRLAKEEEERATKKAAEKAAAEAKAKKGKKVLLVATPIAAVVILALIALFIFGRPLDGTWIRQLDDNGTLAGMTVEVSRNGGVLEGKIISMPSGANAFEVGQTKWFEIKKVGFGKYKFYDLVSYSDGSYSYEYDRPSMIRVLPGGNRLMLTVESNDNYLGKTQVWIKQE